jgi:hypothetical protein
MSITRLGIPGCSATPPDPITPIMQAAERLIRVQGGETEVAVYWPLVKERTGSQYLNRRLVDAARRDDERLVLSAILPKGKRPESIGYQRKNVWVRLYGQDFGGGEFSVPAYKRDEEQLAEHWQAWDEFQRKLSALAS